MPSPHDRPDPVEMLAAVREFLAADVAAGMTGALAFKVRVAVNMLAIVQRQVGRADADCDAHAARLNALGCQDDTELAARIRAGDFDDDREVFNVLWAVVADKVRVTNPKYANVTEGAA